MFKIGDFSKLSRVPVKTLRYYDEIGLLKPAEIDRFTNYRYYAVAQLTRLNRILVLKELGLSLEEINELLTEDLTEARLRDILHGRRTELLHQINAAGARLARLEEWLTHIAKEGKMPEYQVALKKVEPILVASARDIIPTYGDISRLYGEIFAFLGTSGISPSGPVLAIYHDTEYKEQDADVEAIVPIGRKTEGTPRVKVKELPEVSQMAYVLYKGEYGNIGEAYQAVMTWIDRNGYRITGNSREVYLQGPGETQNPQDYLTEVQFPVEK